MIKMGEQPIPPPPLASELALYDAYRHELRLSYAISNFYHTNGDDGGRFPLTGKGIVNLFALFAESALQLKAPHGRVGIIVPTGIATDDSTSAFFRHLVQEHQLQALYDFENRGKLFPDVDSRQRFSVLSLAPSDSVDVACYLSHPRQLAESVRHAHLQPEDLSRINPNTGTCPLFRCEEDAALSVRIYNSVPILIDDFPELHANPNPNPWGITFKQGLFNMTSDSHLFRTSRDEGEDLLPLYEGKLIHHYDHRFNTFTDVGAKAEAESVSPAAKQNPRFEISPRYWVARADVIAKLPKCCRSVPEWFIGFRDITNATNERTLIMSFFPFAGVGHTMPLVFTEQPLALQTCFVANASAMVLDYIARQKVGGTHMTYFYLKQFPFLPPTAYSEADVAFISSRVLELSYSSYSMRPLARALGYEGEPFIWDEARRAQLKAELDAYYARLYGLSREELAYILDPTTKYPHDCPTLTFPGLQNNELRAYGEFRTRRLILSAYDELTRQGK